MVCILFPLVSQHYSGQVTTCIIEHKNKNRAIKTSNNSPKKTRWLGLIQNRLRKRGEELRGGERKRGGCSQLGSVWKASLKSNVFNCFLKVHKEGARRTSSGSWFYKVGATTKKALPLVENLWAFLGVAIQRSLIWVGQLTLRKDALTSNMGPNCGGLCMWVSEPWTWSGMQLATSGGEPELERCCQIYSHPPPVLLLPSGPVEVSRSGSREAPCREHCSSQSGRWPGPAPKSWGNPSLGRAKLGD